jgi:CDP-paratose 2-epimerase
MKLLITGGCGFLGSNLAAQAILQNNDLLIFDNLSRYGSLDNLKWLQGQGKFTFQHGDIRNQNDVDNLIRNQKPDAVFHLAGQVAMTTSVLNPEKDFQINTMGSFYLLDAIRKYSPKTVVLYASSNKIYGDIEHIKYDETPTRYVPCGDYANGFDEQLRINFQSPYGCSKGATDQYMLDFHKIYGLKTVVFRHSSIYGGRQYPTYDQGWVGWFCKHALDLKNNLNDKPISIAGTGKQVRDLLHVSDLVSLYFSTLSNIEHTQGQAFNIGGGIENSLSILELFQELDDILGIKINYINSPTRISDQKFFVANLTKINKLTSWRPLINKRQGLEDTLKWLTSND